MYSANPFIGRSTNFSQGFDLTEHPWDDKYRFEAHRIIREKLFPQDRSSELTAMFMSRRITKRALKSSGELAQKGVESWLDNSQNKKPFFIFLNYMEAHRPYVPAPTFREKIMNPEQIRKSFNVDRSWAAMWSYTFGLTDYSDEEIEITRLTYDAVLAELDDLFKKLIVSLKNKGCMDNTVVILTSDHGEHLGEQHMLDHQYSVYESLMRVPLVVYHPGSFNPGRDNRPVMNSDIFPTLLELTGIKIPKEVQRQTVSLLSPLDKRVRIGECPAYSKHPFRTIKSLYPSFDTTPWKQRLRAVYLSNKKYIWSSKGKNMLFDLASDPGETKNLINVDKDSANKLEENHGRWLKNLQTIKIEAKKYNGLSEEERNQLESLGYLGSKQD
jgi:arylsulfatase A-like enzyme